MKLLALLISVILLCSLFSEHQKRVVNEPMSEDESASSSQPLDYWNHVEIPDGPIDRPENLPLWQRQVDSK